MGQGKRFGFSLLVFLLVFAQTSCSNAKYKKYSADYFGIFDTYVSIICYAKNDSDFKRCTEIIYGRLKELHEYFNAYDTYEGVNNIKTINDNAGIAPVPVVWEIIELLKMSKQAYYMTQGTINVALGPVLSVWHDYREAGIDNPSMAEIPPMDILQNAAVFTDIENIVINKENCTVFLSEAGMSLDVGAIAKGFAAQLAIDEAKAQGVTSCLIYMGGNVTTLGAPLENGKQHWSIGVQNPLDGMDDTPLDVIYINDMSAVTSGDYQRYYTVDSIRYNHIINPETLMPADRYRSVTILHTDSGLADILSTALFILPYEDGLELAEAAGAGVLWVMPDMTIITNGNYDEVSKTFGGRFANDSSATLCKFVRLP